MLSKGVSFRVRRGVLATSHKSFLTVRTSTVRQDTPRGKRSYHFVQTLVRPSLLARGRSIEGELLSPLLKGASHHYFLIPSTSPSTPQLKTLLRRVGQAGRGRLPKFRLRDVNLLRVLLTHLCTLFPSRGRARRRVPNASVDTRHQVITCVSRRCPRGVSLTNVTTTKDMSEDGYYRLFGGCVRRSPVSFLGQCHLRVDHGLLSSARGSVLRVTGTYKFSDRDCCAGVFSRGFGCAPARCHDHLSWDLLRGGASVDWASHLACESPRG